MNYYVFFLAIFIALFWQFTSSLAEQDISSRNIKAIHYLYQHEPKQAINELKKQINQQGFIHQAAWIVPSIIADQQQTYYPKTFGLKHKNQHVQQALDLLKIKQLLLAKDTILAERLYQKMISNQGGSTIVLNEAKLAMVDHYLIRMPDMLKAEFYLNSLTIINKDPVFYPEMMLRKIKILMAKKQYQAALLVYGDLIVDYPAMDLNRDLFQAINAGIGQVMAFNDCFKSNEARYQYLLNCFEQGFHQMVQDYGYYLLRHAYQYTQIIVDVKTIVALSLYINCDYDASIELFQEVIRSPFQFEHHHIARLYMAKCFDEIGQSEHGLKILNKLLKSKLVSNHIKNQALYDACIIAKKINLEEDFFDYKQRLKKNKNSTFLMNQLQWNQQWDLYSFSKSDEVIKNGVSEQLNNKYLAGQIIDIYQDIKQDYGFDNLAQAFAFMPMSYADYYFMKTNIDNVNDTAKDEQLWIENGFKDLAIKKWRYTESQNNRKDNWYCLSRSQREVNAFLNITQQNTVFSYVLETIPIRYRLERYPFHHYYSIKQEKDKIDPFMGLAMNHQVSKKHFNAYRNDQYLNPDPSQILRWAYELDIELDDINSVSQTDIKNVSYRYFQQLSENLSFPHLILIALKENILEANRIKTFNSQSFKQSQQLIDDTNTSLFVESVLQKNIMYRFLSSMLNASIN